MDKSPQKPNKRIKTFLWIALVIGVCAGGYFIIAEGILGEGAAYILVYGIYGAAFILLAAILIGVLVPTKGKSK